MSRIALLSAVIVAGFGLIAAALAVGYSGVVFSAAKSYSLGCQESYWLAAGRINRDHRSDLVVGSDETFSVEGHCVESVLMLAGARGRFSSPRTVEGRAGPTAIADFNGDGNRDLVLNRSDGGVLLLGNGRGGFPTRTTFPVGQPGYPAGGLAVGDLNGDRRRDLVAAGHGLWLLLGDGAGGFAAARELEAGGRAESVAVADFNRDSNLDLVVTTPGPRKSTLRVLLGDGEGRFMPRRARLVGHLGRLAIGQFNRDDRPDLAITSHERGVRVLLGNGQGGFSRATTHRPRGQALSVAVADFNRDRKADLAVGVEDYPRRAYVQALFGDGKGRFSPAGRFPIPRCAVGSFCPESLVVGYFNSDRAPDVAVTNALNGGISVLLNNTRQALGR